MYILKLMNKRCALSLLICFSLALLGVAFHHHADGAPHDDCSLCFTICHHANVAIQDAPQISPLSSLVFFTSIEHEVSLPSDSYAPYSNRAPPA
jgi:hypothetical protein